MKKDARHFAETLSRVCVIFLVYGIAGEIKVKPSVLSQKYENWRKLRETVTRREKRSGRHNFYGRVRKLLKEEAYWEILQFAFFPTVSCKNENMGDKFSSVLNLTCGNQDMQQFRSNLMVI
jgi:hypothetical protein